MSRLAIIVPAYKARFFRQTLLSLANQTCKDFTIYVGDDASNEDFQTIVNEFSDRINISYKRFDANLGAKDLVSQWERCINISNNEPWIWLFSDDDYIGPDCVRLFYEEIARNPRREIYHFNVKVVDGNNQVIRNPIHFPNIISSKDFFKKKETAQIESFVVEYIFSRSIYKDVGGFQKFDLAWGSDIATWVKMSHSNGIKTIDGDYVYWRSSSYNITPNHQNTMVYRKFNASLEYMQWAKQYFSDDYIKCFLAKSFYRLLFHYSMILNFSQIRELTDVAYKKDIINRLLKDLMIITFPLTKSLKRIKSFLYKSKS